ncbi:ATP-binding protein [Deinococcus sonorensis]|uniref:histidine kinase n=2 Tax=Deinococcus sonorensis TaxID=309891 RepID=A0AAU7U5V8_9DEIO
MIFPLDLVVLTHPDDVLHAARRTSLIADRLGIPALVQTRVGTAVAELARNALAYGAGGAVHLGVRSGVDGQFLTLEVQDHGAGFKLEQMLEQHPDHGLNAVRRLVDHLTARVAPGRGMRVCAEQRLTGPLWTQEALAELAATLETTSNGTPLDLARRHNAQLLSTLQREQDTNRGMATLQRVTARLLSANSSADVAEAVLSEGLSSVGASGGVIVLRPEGGPLRLLAARGERWMRHAALLLQTVSPVSDCIQLEQPVVLATRADIARRYPALLATGPGELRALAALPLQVGRELVGSLMMSFTHEVTLTTPDLDFLQALAGSCAQALDRARLYDLERDHAEELERRVEERTGRLQELNMELEAFAYSMSQDLREPLRHMQGFLGLLERQLEPHLDDKMRRHLSIIHTAGNRMNALIDDLVQFSQFGRRELHLQDVRLDMLVVQVRSDLDAISRGRTVRWQVGPLPTVQADALLLRQVLAHLLHNALKFTRDREVAVIEVSATLQDDFHLIHVRDNGVGFDPLHADRLFRLFQRLHRDDTLEGAGVGLANVRRIVVRHGGRVFAEGHPGAGACFSFSLPAVPPPPAGSMDRNTHS